jgi:NitT/TauT family transport system permease protein
MVSATTGAVQERAQRRTPRVKRRTRKTPSRPSVWTGRILLLAAILLLWQYLPSIGALHTLPIFNPFFVSSPSLVVSRLGDLLGFTGTGPTMWSNLEDTLVATLLGVVIGTLLGAVLGLLLSESALAQHILSPFLSFFNAMPRIALVPIFVILVGASLKMEVVTTVTVVFFLVFYNALTGGSSVPAHVIDNAELLGATRLQVMAQVRTRYVFVWTIASLPNAISFGIVSAVTAELLAGQLGMGTLLMTSITTVDSTLTFSVVIVLAVVGVALVGIAQLASRRALRWWEAN